MSRSALASDISTLSIIVVNSGHSAYAACSTATSPTASRRRAEAVPAGQVDAGLRPREHPRDRAQIIERLATDSPRRAGREPMRSRPDLLERT